MALHRIYIDEVGNHDLNHVDEPNQRYLSLTGVILESSYIQAVVQPEMDKIKRTFFQGDPDRDPDEPIIFHRKEMVNRRFPFHALRDPAVEQRFNETLLDCLRRWDYRLGSVCKSREAATQRSLTPS